MQSVRCLLPDRIDYGNKGQGIENTDKLEVVNQRVYTGDKITLAPDKNKEGLGWI